MSARVERIGDAELWLGDCREILPGLSGDDAVVITDPPYGIGIKTSDPSRSKRPYIKRGDTPRVAETVDHRFAPIIGDNEPFDPNSLLGFKKIVLWGANNYADRLPASACWFAWDKKCGRAAASDIGDCELAWVRGLPYCTVRAFRHMWAGFQRDSQAGASRLHPTEKPIALMEWCLSFFAGSEPVLDPYMGSGTTGVACARLGRKFIGMEIEPRYFDTSCRRIEEAQRQGDLLRDVAPKAPEKQNMDLFGDRLG